jgi:hypothetical protein
MRGKAKVTSSARSPQVTTLGGRHAGHPQSGVAQVISVSPVVDVENVNSVGGLVDPVPDSILAPTSSPQALERRS